MKTYTNRPPGLFKAATLAIIGFVVSTVFLQGTAFATTAANAVITNTATVNYEDSTGTAQTAIQASVNVTVNLVTAHPTLSSPANNSVFTGNALDFSYTITSNANGPDAYSLTVSDNLPQTGITSYTHVYRDAGDTTDITSVDLGASSVAAAALAGATAITVPNDGSGAGGNTPVNGIEANDIVVINGATYTVASTIDNANGTSTINLTTGLSGAVSVGDLIAEQKTFISRVTPVATEDGSTFDLTTTADDGVTAGAAPTHTVTVTVNVAPDLTVTKFVRNISNGTNGGGTCITVDTGLGGGNVQYCDGTATGEPGDILEYVIEIANSATGGQAQNVVISDPVPAFTTLVTGAGTIALDPGTGTWSQVADTADNGDFAESDGTTVYIYAGSGGDDTTAGVGNGTGGNLNSDTTTLGAFRVTIDN